MTGTTSDRVPSLRSTSTASPRLTASGVTRCGLPSTSVNALAMTGMSSVARTIAQAIRWVNESFLPAALSCPRRPASSSTASVRKLVAVGIERLSSMKRARVAAGPRIGAVDAPAGAAGGAGVVGAAPPLPEMAASTSCFVTRPRGPLPPTAPRSMPCSAAIRAATGVASASPLAGAGASVPGRAASTLGAGAACAGAPAPASIRHSAVPTGTVWSASTRSSATVPATGEGTSASTLSVEISTSGSSTATLSPGFTRHSRIVPSATESPISGKVTSTVSPAESPAPRRPSRRAPRRVARVPPRAAGPSAESISPSACPTCTVSSGPTRISASTPAAGEGTSASTLSVDTSTIGSSTATVSPTCLSHSSTVPSVTDSPMAGMVIWTLVPCVAIPTGTLPVRLALQGRLGCHAPPLREFLHMAVIEGTRRLKHWGWGYEDQQPSRAGG